MDDEFIYADELSFHILMDLAEVTSPDSNPRSARNRSDVAGQQPEQCQKQKVRILHADGHSIATR